MVLRAIQLDRHGVGKHTPVSCVRRLYCCLDHRTDGNSCIGRQTKINEQKRNTLHWKVSPVFTDEQAGPLIGKVYS